MIFAYARKDIYMSKLGMKQKNVEQVVHAYALLPLEIAFYLFRKVTSSIDLSPKQFMSSK